MTTPDDSASPLERVFVVRRFSPPIVALVLSPLALLAMGALASGYHVAGVGFALTACAAALVLSTVTRLEVDPASGALVVRRIRSLVGAAEQGYALPEVREVIVTSIDDSDLVALTLRYVDRDTRVCDGPPDTVRAAARWLKRHQRDARKSSASARL